jgi:hypothetical protein
MLIIVLKLNDVYSFKPGVISKCIRYLFYLKIIVSGGESWMLIIVLKLNDVFI